VLGAGQMHRHRISYSPNKVLDGEVVQDVTYGFKGLTCFTFAVFRGAPANDLARANFSTSRVNLAWMSAKQYKYTFVSDVTTNWYVSNTLPVLANVEIVQEDSGLVSVEANA
jgi:hypothetical protein